MLYVDPTLSADAAPKYKTLAAALAAATSSENVISVKAGVYDEGALTLTADLICDRGVTIQNANHTTAKLIITNGFNIFGEGDFRNYGEGYGIYANLNATSTSGSLRTTRIEGVAYTNVGKAPERSNGIFVYGTRSGATEIAIKNCYGFVYSCSNASSNHFLKVVSDSIYGVEQGTEIVSGNARIGNNMFVFANETYHIHNHVGGTTDGYMEVRSSVNSLRYNPTATTDPAGNAITHTYLAGITNMGHLKIMDCEIWSPIGGSAIYCYGNRNLSVTLPNGTVASISSGAELELIGCRVYGNDQAHTIKLCGEVVVVGPGPIGPKTSTLSLTDTKVWTVRDSAYSTIGGDSALVNFMYCNGANNLVNKVPVSVKQANPVINVNPNLK